MKRLIFFILPLLCLFVCKPKKEHTNIPDAPIYFQIRLDSYPTFKNGIGNILQCPKDLKFNETGSFGYSGTVLLINDFEVVFLPDYFLPANDKASTSLSQRHACWLSEVEAHYF